MMGAFLVEVRWTSRAVPDLGDRRLVAVGPYVAATEAVLRRKPAGCATSEPDAADEHLVVDDTGPWLAIADVIIGPAAPRGRSPGRLVAVSALGQEYVLEVAGRRGRLVPLMTGAEDDPWPYASFVHAWLVAGRPFEDLDAACLSATGGSPRARCGMRVTLDECPSRRVAS